MRADDIFFPGLALLILGLVVVGFGESYFLAGMVTAKLPSTLVHIHGALFIAWIFFLVIQTFLVASSRIRWHMTFGFLGTVLAPLMLVFGVLVLFESIRRGRPGMPPGLLLTSDAEELALFLSLTVWGFLARRNVQAHKRLMILATIAMLGPAIGRLPLPIGLEGIIAIYFIMPLLMVAYDFWAIGRVHRTTAIATALIIVGMLVVLPAANLPVVHAVVESIRST